MSRLTILDVQFEVLRPEVLHPIILEDEKDLILFDCGYPTFSDKLRKAAGEKGVDFDRLTKIIITHQDYDHMGALLELTQQYPNVEVMASEKEAPYISGEKLFIRQQNFDETPPDTTTRRYQRYVLIQSMYGELKPARVDRILHDWERLPFAGGMRIIPTPGHMPGHISVYLEEFKTLVTGDALVLRKDRISYSDPTFSLDHEAATHSVECLLDLEIDALACYHGGLYRGNIHNDLLELIAQQSASEASCVGQRNGAVH
ncbi:MAG: MBL fold metallo-hydrolase [Anaerofustis sp.]